MGEVKVRMKYCLTYFSLLRNNFQVVNSLTAFQRETSTMSALRKMGQMSHYELYIVLAEFHYYSIDNQVDPQLSVSAFRAYESIALSDKSSEKAGDKGVEAI